MHFYRPLYPLRALTFDLDDTLYDNRPVIARTEKESVLFLQNYHSALRSMTQEDYQYLRSELRQREPEIYHDVTYWRWRSVELAMRNVGLSTNEARSGADASMEVVSHWRSKIEVSPGTHNILSALSDRWPLVAITNGNVNPAACGLEIYFSHVLRAGSDGRAKPYKDMYHLASERLGIPRWSILHVGDDLEADVTGAIRCGMQACWLNKNQGGSGNNYGISDYYISEKLWPHLEISHLASLLTVLL